MTVLSLDLQLHLERSQCINAFVEVEKALGDLAAKLAPGRENELISHRIVRLREVPASPLLSKEQRKQLHMALDDAEALITIRNDIVHGALTILSDGGKPIAAFINVRQTEWLAPLARLLTVDQIRDLSVKANQLAGRIVKASIRPSQQPPSC